MKVVKVQFGILNLQPASWWLRQHAAVGRSNGYKNWYSSLNWTAPTWRYTLPKTKIAPENGWLEDEMFFWGPFAYFQGWNSFVSGRGLQGDRFVFVALGRTAGGTFSGTISETFEAGNRNKGGKGTWGTHHFWLVKTHLITHENSHAKNEIGGFQIWKVDFFETKSQSFTPGISNIFYFDDWNEIIVVNDGKKHCILSYNWFIKILEKHQQQAKSFYEKTHPIEQWLAHWELAVGDGFSMIFQSTVLKETILERRKSDLSSQVLKWRAYGAPKENRSASQRSK